MIMSQKNRVEASFEVADQCSDVFSLTALALSLSARHFRRLELSQSLGKASAIEVLQFIDTALDFYCHPQRCTVCEAAIDVWFAAWHCRAAEKGVPLGVVYAVLCDAAYFKTLDSVFRRRNGWAKSVFYAALALCPQLPCFDLCCSKTAPKSSFCVFLPERPASQKVLFQRHRQ